MCVCVCVGVSLYISVGRNVPIKGVLFSASIWNSGVLSLKIWVGIQKNTCLERCLERDGGGKKQI